MNDILRCEYCGKTRLQHQEDGACWRNGACYWHSPAEAPNSPHPLTADRLARYAAALREIATIMPSAAGAIAENALKDDDDGVTL